MSNQHENGLMILLARAMARDSGVEVLTGDSAKTDGKRIWMPPLPPDDHKSFSLGMRWVLHETAHINYTDIKVLKEAENGLVMNMLQTLEDIRIEAAKSRELPGAGRRFSEGIMALKETGKIGIREEDSPATVMSKFMLYKLRADLLGQPLVEEGKVAQGALKSMIGEAKMLKAEAIGRQSVVSRNTGEVLQLARSIAAMLEEDPEEDRDQQDQQGQDDAQQPSAESIRENVQQMLQGMDETEEAETNLEEIAKGEMDEASQEEAAREAGGAMPGANEYQPARKGDGTALMHQVRTASAAMRETFESAIQAKTLASRHHVQRGTRIDPKRLARLKAGDNSIFIQKVEGEKIDTAVHLAIDLSGSMSGVPEMVAKQAAMAFAMALDGFQGVDVSMTAFGSYLKPLKGWEDDLNTAAANLAGTGDGGGTAMDEAVMDGADKLMASRRPRKLMFVVTDGQAYRPADLAKVVSSIRDMGIESFGVGIRADASGVFGREHSIMIDDVNQLAGTLFGLLQTNMFTEALAA
jgi:cobalamin biosynthesis protein CobT